MGTTKWKEMISYDEVHITVKNDHYEPKTTNGFGIETFSTVYLR
jgi:hypothetical protein